MPQRLTLIQKAKRALLVLLGLVVLLLIIGFFLPGSYHVERTTTVKAKPEAVFPWLNNFKKWPEWTAWNVHRYPDMRISYEGPESGVGATYLWEGKTSGQGTMKITKSEPGKGISYDLDFERGKYVSKGSITLEQTGNLVAIRWINEGDLGKNPVNRWFGLFMDNMMGPDFAKGLDNLRRSVEAAK
jgi:hypothetical protein